MTALQEKQMYTYLEWLTKNHRYKIILYYISKDKTDSNFNFPKLSYNTRDKVSRRWNIY